MKISDEELKKILARRDRKRKNKVNFRVGSLVRWGSASFYGNGQAMVVTKMIPSSRGIMGSVTYLDQNDSKYYTISITSAIKHFEIIVF